MSTPKTAPDFGEPWSDSEFRGMADCQDRNGTPIVCDFHFVHDEHRARIVSCVNACAGMSDPAAEIQALREAVKEAGDALEWAIENMNPPFEWEPFTKANATLSKLQYLA